MTLDDAIKHAEEVAEENQRVVDTGIVFDDITIDEFYCDDTEVIAEHLVSCETCAEEHKQLAEWLKDYKRLLEQKLVLDKIRAEILEEKDCAYADFERYKVEYLGQDWEDVFDSLPQDDFRYGMERVIEIIDKYKADMRGGE